MSIPNQECPEALTLHTEDSPLRLCGKSTGRSCNSILIPTGNASYSNVRGRVKAYQFGSTDAFGGRENSQRRVDRNYVDGVSITYGSNPRKHVWTYAAANHLYFPGENRRSTCPSTGDGARQPNFVGDDYFCSSGNPGSRSVSILYPTPLWSNILGDCSDCGYNDLFFCVKLPEPTTDDLEIRICTNEGLSNEDVRIDSMDLYIR